MQQSISFEYLMSTRTLSYVLTNGGYLTLTPGRVLIIKHCSGAQPSMRPRSQPWWMLLVGASLWFRVHLGTGKSFTGIALIKVLSKNRDKARLGPIICVCYTNDALDQLLEHFVQEGIKRIIRLGSRSISQLLKPLNLRQVLQQQSKTKTEKHIERESEQ